MCDGACFQRPTPVRHTNANDYGLGLRDVPTPTVNGNRNRKGLSKKSGDGLSTWAKKFPTPTAHEARDSGVAPSQFLRRSATLPVAVGGRLNAEWVEWLMGWPIGATELGASATDRYQLWRRSHGMR
jgi:hypothetical protein